MIRDFFSDWSISQLVLGVLASLLAAAMVPVFGWGRFALEVTLRNRRLKGDWEAWWQPVQPGLPSWIGQKMRVRTGLRKLNLSSVPHGRVDRELRHDSDLQFEWAGQIEIRGKLYLTGSWYKPGGPGCGTFVLRRSNDDNYLCGYIIGDNRDGDVKMGPFVLGKDRCDVLAAMRWLRVNWREFEPPDELKTKL